ncbi:MAG: ATP-grasp domain-containing protein [Thermoguttaceae bacterium]|nr:ATP-grasp domain-containing protein [Thermoguttaceae bacterium]
MTNAWVLYNRMRLAANRWFAERLVGALCERGVDARLVVADTPDELPDERPDIVLNRSADAEMAESLEDRGVLLWNNSEITRICNDKYLTYRALEGSGLFSMPNRLVTVDDLPSISGPFPAVLKSRGGHGGTEVFLVRDQKELKEAFAKIGGPTAVFQRAAADLGKDLRVYVLGKEIVAAMLRHSESDFRSNYCLGGKAERIGAVPPEVVRQVNLITDRFRFGLAGIDFIFDSGNPVFNEIEDVVGTRMLYARTDLDIAAVYVDFVLKRTG